jgi:hypothetical protein
MKHKFRGHTGEKWVYGDLLNQFAGCEIAECNIYHKVDPTTVGEYVADDRTNKPIYTGDIIEIDTPFNGKELYHVVYDKLNYRYGLKQSLRFGGIKAFSNYGKVVGNIYHNENLLEKQESEYYKNYKGLIEEPTCLTKQYRNKRAKEFLPR